MGFNVLPKLSPIQLFCSLYHLTQLTTLQILVIGAMPCEKSTILRKCHWDSLLLRILIRWVSSHLVALVTMSTSPVGPLYEVSVNFDRTGTRNWPHIASL
jgi:hypothetical protein